MSTTATNIEIHNNLAAEIYHARTDLISNSMLGEAEDSIELFHGRYVAKTMPLKETTPAMRFGTLFHESVLLGIESQAVLVPESVLDARGYRAGQTYRDFAAWHAGKTLLVREEWDRLCRMIDATLKNPIALSILNHADAAIEQSIFWQDEATGLKLKSRLDARRLSIPLIADVKTVRNTSFRHLATSVHDFGYARQCVMYREAAKAAFGIAHDFVFIAVEKELPHRVQCFDLSKRALEQGWESFRGGLDRLAECYQTGDWTTRGLNEVISLDLPNWAYNDQWEIQHGDGD